MFISHAVITRDVAIHPSIHRAVQCEYVYSVFYLTEGGSNFLSHCVRVEMDCTSTALIFKESQQPISPSSIIWVLSDTHGLLYLGDTHTCRCTHTSSRSDRRKCNSRSVCGWLHLMDFIAISHLMRLCSATVSLPCGVKMYRHSIY